MSSISSTNGWTRFVEKACLLNETQSSSYLDYAETHKIGNLTELANRVEGLIETFINLRKPGKILLLFPWLKKGASKIFIDIEVNHPFMNTTMPEKVIFFWKPKKHPNPSSLEGSETSSHGQIILGRGAILMVNANFPDTEEELQIEYIHFEGELRGKIERISEKLFSAVQK